MDNHANRPEIKEALSGKEGRSFRFSTTIQDSMMYVAASLHLFLKEDPTKAKKDDPIFKANLIRQLFRNI